MNRLNKGWLYGIIVMLSQTCNPDYKQPSPYSNNDFSFNQDMIIEEEEPVFEDHAIEEEMPVFEDQAIEEEMPMVEEVPEPEPDQIFKVVETMPRFPGCENSGITDKGQLQRCAEEKMLKFIYGNIKYPEIARENGIEGTVIIQFVVEKNGTITNSKVLREPGGGCGNEAKRVVGLMPKWIPGIQRGQPVKVQYNLPVRFKLSGLGKGKN